MHNLLEQAIKAPTVVSKGGMVKDCEKIDQDARNTHIELRWPISLRGPDRRL